MRLSVFCSDRPTAPAGRIAAFCRSLAEGGFELRLERGLMEMLERENGWCELCRDHGIGLFEGWEDNGRTEDEAAISIGGDGTFLRVARRIGARGVGLIGVNAGHLGFLTQYSLEEGGRLARDLQEGRMAVQHRMLLRLGGCGMPEGVWPYALNEISIQKEDTASMIEVRVFDDEDFIAGYLGDGLIVSTPTGSTAYALAAGGPLVDPRLRSMLMVPIASHTLTLRPLMLPATERLRLIPESRTGRCRVSLDGCSFPLELPAELHVVAAPFTLKLLRRPGESFFSSLRHKLLWAER